MDFPPFRQNLEGGREGSCLVNVVTTSKKTRIAFKVVRWKAEDLAVTGVCRGSRGFTMVFHGAASKKTPGTQESEK